NVLYQGPSEQRVQLVEPGARPIVSCQTSGSLHLFDDWMECAVRVLRGAEVAQARMRLLGDALHQRGRKSALANTSLSAQRDDLTFASFGVSPPAQQQFEFVLASDEFGEVFTVQCLESALHRTRPRHHPSMYKPWDTL